MSWFKHLHYWRQKTGVSTIRGSEDRPSGGLIVEDCHCGAVRTIEFYPGEAPIVRITQSENEPVIILSNEVMNH